MLLGPYTEISAHDRSIADLVRRDVARLLDQLYTSVDEEASDAIEAQIGPCKGKRTRDLYLRPFLTFSC